MTNMNSDTIQKAITTKWLGRPVHFRPSVTSTNDLLKEMAEKGAPAGTMLITDFQSQGKGRLNRRWDAPPGSSLLLSLLFRPTWPAYQAHWLTMIAGTAAVSAVRQETGLAPALKWPNDVMILVEGQWRKFGGLLLEANIEDGQLTYAVMGGGLNLNIPFNDLPEAMTPAASLLSASGRLVNRLSLLNRYLLALEELYEAADSGQSPHYAWRDLLITIGKPVQVSGRTLETPIEGTAEGVDEWGRLLVREQNGRLHALAVGDISLRG
jgi:BirA family biotin operon repressor/biotin-[acetyl-CoA-carboxylase] ligase